MPEIGYVYFDKTGLYFDYDDNSNNDARNVIDDNRKWFVWRKWSPEQRNISAIEKFCTLGEFGVTDVETCNG